MTSDSVCHKMHFNGGHLEIHNHGHHECISSFVSMLKMVYKHVALSLPNFIIYV